MLDEVRTITATVWRFVTKKEPVVIAGVIVTIVQAWAQDAADGQVQWWVLAPFAFGLVLRQLVWSPATVADARRQLDGAAELAAKLPHSQLSAIIDAVRKALL